MSVSFRYRAATLEGQAVEGTLQAPSRQAVLDQLHRQRLYPMAVEEVTGPSSGRRRWRQSRSSAIAVWTRNAATLVGAGMPLDRVLAFSADTAGHEGVSATLRSVQRSVQEGATLSDALSRHPRYFGPLFVAMVSAGEESGALDAVLDRLADHLDESAEFRSQVQAALLYPALMALVSAVGVTVLLVVVVPRFSAILRDVGGTLPFSTRLLVGISLVLSKAWWLWLLLLAGGAYAIYAAANDPARLRAWHRQRLAWPWTGELELKFGAARLTRTLGLLLKSGIPVLSALRIARGSVPNLALGEDIARAVTVVAEGSALAPALAGVFPPMAVQMIAVGEESGRLDDLCLRVADAYDGEVRRAMRTAVALVEPAMIILFGILVGFVALAMLQAIYSINSSAF